MTNINADGSINEIDKKFIDSGLAESEYKKFQLEDGDILLVMVGGSLGKIGIVDPSVLPAVLNQNMWRLVRFGGVNRDYFVLGVRSINRDQLEITDSTHGHLSQGSYLSALFPLPPLAEQERIVERVKELIALCDRLKARLTEARETQERLAESIVKQAVACNGSAS